jgi:hypothetical protein
LFNSKITILANVHENEHNTLQIALKNFPKFHEQYVNKFKPFLMLEHTSLEWE